MFANETKTTVHSIVQLKLYLFIYLNIIMWHSKKEQLVTRYIKIRSVWLAQLVRALASSTHVRSCVQEDRFRSPERTSLTLAAISPG